MADQYVFGEVIPFGAAMVLCGAFTAAAAWGLSIAVSGRGKSRTWLRDPAYREAKATDMLPPCREDWTRGLRFMSWWSRLLLPVLLMMPGGLVALLFDRAPQTTVLDALLGALMVPVPFGLALLLLRHRPGEFEPDST